MAAITTERAADGIAMVEVSRLLAPNASSGVTCRFRIAQRRVLLVLRRYGRGSQVTDGI